MPKRYVQRPNPPGKFGNGGSRFSSLKEFVEHDDRDQERDRDRHKERNTTRRVSFKPSLLSNHTSANVKKRIAELAARRLEDDEDMVEFASSSKYDDKFNGPRRKGSPIPKGKFGNMRKLVPSALGWYQVTVSGGHRYNRNDVMRVLLNSVAPNVFNALYWRTEKNCVIFFVDNFEIAEQIQRIDRSIQMQDSFRLFVRVRAGCPMVAVDELFKEKMKVVMAKRYNPATRALDLSKFHADTDFREVFVGLCRAPVLSAAIDIIQKNIPDLLALNLNDNCLTSLESFKNIGERLPDLRILYLDENRLSSLAHLLVLRNVPITELVLKNNPLRTRYRDQSHYVSEVRRKFPKLIKLDGVDLEPKISFDGYDDRSMPSEKASFLCDAAGTDIVRQFVEQYFLIFDTDNRQPLLDAYHEQAMMSLHVSPASQAGRLEAFWKFNRNFLRIVNNDELNKMRTLKVGRLQVVSALAEWPKTQHDPQTFTVDLSIFTPQMIAFVVTGLFKELDSAGSSGTENIRYFARHFVIVPAGSGFCIRNEDIHISSPSHTQMKTFLRPATSIQSATNAVTSTITSPAATNLQQRLQMNQPNTTVNAMAQLGSPINQIPQAQPTATADNETTRLQMVRALSNQTNMNLEWSKKCLEETNWDFFHAAFVFNKLNQESKIPPEAFVK